MSVDQNSPLRDLYADKNAMPVLMYPNSLGNARQGHFISFSILVPTKSTYQETGIKSTLQTIGAQSNFEALKNIQQAANKAASTVGGVVDTVGKVADAANKALSTANQLAGTAASVVGVVSGAKSIITGGIAAGSPLTALSGITGGINGLSSIASSATSIPGVSSFLKDPMGSASNAFSAIKDFINDPAKAFSSDAASSSQKGADQTNGPKFTPFRVKPSGYINLYMPDTVSMNQHASYKDLSMTEAMGAVGLAAEGAKEGSNIADSFSSLGEKLWDNPSGAVKTITEQNIPPIGIEGAANVFGSGIKIKGKEYKALDAKGLTDYWLKQGGYAINPQYEVIFTAMDLRTFQFDFTFTPKSPAEAATVREIIKLFRKHAAPNLYNGGGRYFDVPATFQIEYRHMDKLNANLHKFAPCALQSIVVDYAPEVGWVTFNDGMPVKTRLTLMFKETEIITRDKIDQGY
jgi:hypothetical protein